MASTILCGTIEISSELSLILGVTFPGLTGSCHQWLTGCQSTVIQLLPYHNWKLKNMLQTSTYQMTVCHLLIYSMCLWVYFLGAPGFFFDFWRTGFFRPPALVAPPRRGFVLWVRPNCQTADKQNNSFITKCTQNK